eukprot:TRINITY_DN34047_c0_g1_i1.p1 TRINITY_DN34047_c0_g1~~TRINITY_DN34047_c0_g1_i1.p1  ORF type:complete len:186 (+),score=25.62 TRINITY_DN34047_c0_g1_i1:24-581(+)
MAELFAGKRLVKLEGNNFVPVDVPKSLSGKTIGLYFSAAWCGPCRQFTPILKDFHQDLTDDGKPFEIVFVSSDRSVRDQIAYMKSEHGPWLTLEHGDPFIEQLKDMYTVRGIPCLAIIQSNGGVVTMEGRQMVTTQGPRVFDKWAAAAPAPAPSSRPVVGAKPLNTDLVIFAVLVVVGLFFYFRQ